MALFKHKRIKEVEAQLAELSRKHETLKEENKALKKKLTRKIDAQNERDMLKAILINCARASIILKKDKLSRSILRDFCKANGIDLTEPPRWSPLYMSTFLRDMIRYNSQDPSNIRGNYRGIRMKLPKKPQKPVIKGNKVDDTCRQVEAELRDHLEKKMEAEMSGQTNHPP